MISANFEYIDQSLHCEGVPLAEIAREVGTPVYVYSQAALMANVAEILTAVPPQSLVCFAIKANGNPAILRLLAQAGLGADVTSGGELFLALHAGFPPQRIIFSGGGKRPDVGVAQRHPRVRRSGRHPWRHQRGQASSPPGDRRTDQCGVRV